MKKILIFLFSLFLSASVHAESDLIGSAQSLLSDSALRSLFAVLSSKTPVYSQFTEYRWFPFRKKPTILRGEMRFSPDLGLSLHYIEPEEQIVIADGKGLLLRDKKGRERSMAADPKSLDSGSALMNILRFDFDTIYRSFDISPSFEGLSWELDFVPKNPKIKRSLGQIIVQGEGEAVKKIEIKRSSNQRVEIFIGETRYGMRFQAAELKRFFR